MATKILGALLIIAGIAVFLYGIKYKDDGYGARATQVRMIGSAFLLFIGGAAFLITNKSLCEIFRLFC